MVDTEAPRRASLDDEARVVEILVSAFHADPAWSWAFPDPALRAEHHRALWTLLVQGAMRYPWVWLTTDRTSASVWIPPEGTELSDEQEARLEPLVTELLGPGAAKVMAAFDLFEEAHPHDVPHYYLTLLGTLAEHRGHGYGLGLLAENLREIDRVAMPAYLESSNIANVPLYARHGFVVHDRFVLPDDGPEIVTMWRDARPAE
jgi:GNAT superfamily N-acetyltransferase